MGLKDLKSNLKNIKFFPDTPGGGSSGLPYIKHGLPENSPEGEYIAGIARTSADFPIRGGTYSTVVSTEDVTRISRFLNDFPKGSIFTSKQVGLQKSNPKIETGGRGGRLNTQIYNLNANLISQVWEQGTGVHINRAGSDNNELSQYQNKYEYIVSENNNNNKNRLVTLTNSKIFNVADDNNELFGISPTSNLLYDYPGGPGSLYGVGNTTIFKATIPSNQINDIHQGANIYETADPQNKYEYITFNDNESKKNRLVSLFNKKLLGVNDEYTEFYNIALADSFLYEYPAVKPGSLYKDKNTTISKAIVPPTPKFSGALSYKQLMDSKEKSIKELDYSPTPISDFRKKTDMFNASKNYNSEAINIASRVGIGNPGARTRDQREFINEVVEGGQDKVNMIPLYYDGIELDPWRQRDGNKIDPRDLIKFAFEVIDNDSPEYSTKVHFRAFITNFSDSHTAEWSGQRYLGRGEKFYTYQGFDRPFSFQFKVAAQSKQEMLPLYQKLNYIASSLYPDYSDQGFMRGNLHKLTIGEYFYRTPGIITSMNITVDNNYPWEIKMTEPETEKKFQTSDFPNKNSNGSPEFQVSNSDADMMELPQVLNVDVTFIPILNELPSLSKFTNTIKNKKGILISNDVGTQENFINRII